MAKRLICCPNVGNEKFEYLYIDTSKLLVENVSDEVTALVSDAKERCCLDKLVPYAMGDVAVPDKAKESLSFDFYKLNSFELFKNTDELRFKTGSDKILFSCLLNYYRREYDGTQQHTFFSEPNYSNTFVSTGDGVEHELTLENREIIKKDKEDIGELETLDKVKTDAEREAEAALAQAEAEQQAALTAAEEKEEKAQKREKSRKKHQRLMEEERYREFRNQDDVQREEYRRLRQYEEEMRQNSQYLTAQYDAGNYSSLPGVLSNDYFKSTYETPGVETLGVAVTNDDLYRLASRMDEFGVPYTVTSETLSDGRQISHVLYSSDYAESGATAKDFFVLENNLFYDNVVSEGNYYNAFQLSALEYAYVNNVDTFYVQNGEYNANQMYRIIDAGLNGHDMAALANPSYSPPQMDALTYFMNQGWDTAPISDPSVSHSTIADNLLQEEIKNNVPSDKSFFESHSYDDFLAYGSAGSTVSFFNAYDNAQKDEYYKHFAAKENEIASKESYNTFKDKLHSSYEQRQQEMNYIGRGVDFLSSTEHKSSGSSAPDVMCKYIDPDTGKEKTIPRSQVTPELVARCEKYWSERDNSSHTLDKSKKGDKPYSPTSSYTPSGRTNSDGSFVPHTMVNRSPGGMPAGGGGGGGRRSPTGNVASNKIPWQRNALDELKVRSAFAKRAGYAIQNYGQCLGNSVFSMAQKTVGKITSADETGTVSSYRSFTNIVRNTTMSAGLVMDVPRQFARVGHRMRYGSAAVERACKNYGGGKYKALTSCAAEKDIRRLEKQQFQKVKKLYGAKVAKMNIREVNSNIKGFNKNIDSIRKSNVTLRGEIQSLYSKKRSGGLSAAETKALRNKLKAYNDNNAKISKKQRDIRKLERIKKLKKSQCKALKAERKKASALGKKERAWRSAPGLFAHSFIGQLNKAGADHTMGGMATASNMAMAYIRSPIRKVVRGVGNVLIKQPLKKVTKKLVSKTKVYHKIRAKKIGRIRKKIRKYKKRQVRIRTMKRGVRKASEKLIGKTATKGFMKLGSGIKRLGHIIGVPFKALKTFTGAVKGFLMKAAVFAGIVLLAVALLATLANALMSTSNSIMFIGDTDTERIDLSSYVDIVNKCQKELEDEISSLANGTGISGEKYDNVFYDYNGTGGNNTAQIITMAYVRFGGLVDDYPEEVEAYIKQLYADSNYVDYTVSEPYKCDNGCEERHYKCYDSIADLDPAATQTRETKHAASDHYGQSGVSKTDEDRYGCKYVEYSCTIQGHGVYNKSGCKYHGDGKEMSSPCSCVDCKEEIEKSTIKKYYCQGYYTAGGRRFVKHSNGKAMDKPCSCDDCKEVEETTEKKYYVCQGYCPGKHKDYDCAGHTEKICYGEHQDIMISVTSLDFDEIFYADTSVAESGATVRGEAYEDKFLISAYCSCKICCGEYSPEVTGRPSTTASGTTPKAKHTLAVDYKNPVVPLGTHVYIDGKEYVVEDTGDLASRGVAFDMYFDSHNAALQWGKRTKTVYKSSVVSEEEKSFRNIFNYVELAKEAATDNFSASYVLQAFGQAKEPEITWKHDRVNSDDENSFADKLKKYDVEHENEEFTNAELNTFEYVKMSLSELKKLCKERELSDSGNAYTLIADRLIPYDKKHPDVFINEPSEEEDELYFEGWTEDNIELVKSYYETLTSDEGDEYYVGLDDVKNLNYGVTNSSSYDFSDIVYDDSSGLTNKQKAVVTTIKKNNLATVSGRCQAWVADVYQAALGGARESRCCANHAGEAWGASNDWSKIQVGASVYGYSSSKYGHVGIYIGDGKVAHNIGYVKVQSLESWVNTYNGQCWGWNGGNNLTGNSKYNCKASGTFMHGSD